MKTFLFNQKFTFKPNRTLYEVEKDNASDRLVDLNNILGISSSPAGKSENKNDLAMAHLDALQIIAQCAGIDIPEVRASAQKNLEELAALNLDPALPEVDREKTKIKIKNIISEFQDVVKIERAKQRILAQAEDMKNRWTADFEFENKRFKESHPNLASTFDQVYNVAIQKMNLEIDNEVAGIATIAESARSIESAIAALNNLEGIFFDRSSKESLDARIGKIFTDYKLECEAAVIIYSSQNIESAKACIREFRYMALAAIETAGARASAIFSGLAPKIYDIQSSALVTLDKLGPDVDPQKVTAILADVQDQYLRLTGEYSWSAGTMPTSKNPLDKAVKRHWNKFKEISGGTGASLI